jgi:hypothetical protein
VLRLLAATRRAPPPGRPPRLPPRRHVPGDRRCRPPIRLPIKGAPPRSTVSPCARHTVALPSMGARCDKGASPELQLCVEGAAKLHV